MSQEYADKLYDEDVSGASLAELEKQDLIDLGIRHGPAILIVKNVQKLKKTSDSLDKCSKTTVCKESPSTVKNRDVIIWQSANSPKKKAQC